MSLEDFRNKIDEIDATIVELIAQRIKLAGQIGSEKKDTNKSIEDVTRECAVMENIRNAARKHNLNQHDVEAVYRHIIDICRKVQDNGE